MGIGPGFTFGMGVTFTFFFSYIEKVLVFYCLLYFKWKKETKAYLSASERSYLALSENAITINKM